MSYVIAAYALTLSAVGLYLGHLVRERRRLARELATGAEPAVTSTHLDPVRARNSG